MGFPLVVPLPRLSAPHGVQGQTPAFENVTAYAVVLSLPLDVLCIYPKKRRGCTMHRLAATTSLLISLTPALAAQRAARAAPFPS